MTERRRKQGRAYRSTARSAPEVQAAAVRLGRRVRQLRLDSGLTQEALASRAQIDGKHLQVIEQGRTNVTLATLVALSTALQVSVADLLESV